MLMISWLPDIGMLTAILTVVPAAYELELREYLETTKPLPATTNFVDDNTATLHGNFEYDHRRRGGNGSLRCWLVFLVVLVVVLCLDRSYMAQKCQHEVAALRAEMNTPLQQWKMQQKKEIEETRRLLKALSNNK